MANNYFSFKQFTIYQNKSAFKVGTDGVLLGAGAEISGVRRILEIGSGTGLISIMLAQRCNAEIITIEPDNESYIQTCDNVNLCNWSSKIEVIHTDLQSYYPENVKFDLIITNPPFFTNSMKSPDPRKSAARHNDSLTSDEILLAVSRLIEDNGSLQLIMPYVEGNIFIAEASKFGLFCNRILKIKPLPTGDIKRLILKFEKDKKTLSEKFLTIETETRHKYTEEYKELTKDFYLDF